MLLYSGYDNTLSICSSKHMQMYFVLQKELLQADILEFDTLFSLLSTLARKHHSFIALHMTLYVGAMNL